MIEVKGLCKFFGQIEAVKNVTLTIEKGEKIVIIGPSGCGKSTFLRCLLYTSIFTVSPLPISPPG